MEKIIDELVVDNSDHISEIRSRIREICVREGAGAVKQTKMVTACAEILRNTLNFADGGEIKIKKVTKNDSGETSLIFVVRDKGPGIDDPEKAMQPGWSGPRSKGLGKGLSGSKNLSDEFELESVPGEGTTVTMRFNL